MTYALTVRQPWAWCIEAGHKRVENRTGGVGRWERAAGERLLIHAGAGWSRRGGEDMRVRRAWWHQLAGARPASWGDPPPLPMAYRRDGEPHHFYDGIRFRQCGEWGETRYEQADGRVRHDVVHLALGNIERVEHQPAERGRLGLWRP